MSLASNNQKHEIHRAVSSPRGATHTFAAPNRGNNPRYTTTTPKGIAFSNIGELVSAPKFWPLVMQFEGGWLCLDQNDKMHTKSIEDGRRIEQILVDVLRWTYRQQVHPKLIILIERSEATSGALQKRLLKMSTGLRGGRWTNVRLCVVTENDFIYVRNPRRQSRHQM